MKLYCILYYYFIFLYLINFSYLFSLFKQFLNTPKTSSIEFYLLLCVRRYALFIGKFT